MDIVVWGVVKKWVRKFNWRSSINVGKVRRRRIVLFLIMMVTELTEFVRYPWIVTSDVGIWVRCCVPGSLCAEALGSLPRHILT